MKRPLFAILCLFATASVVHAEDQTLVPFVLPWDDASPGITDMSGLLAKPAGGRGFVTVRDGHLDIGGERFRIFGVNMAFGGNFPTHADAEKVAARLAKFGINCVRFHHMDNQRAPGGIWSADMRTFDPQQLDKLDYFIAQLKRHGVYADLNLHVSREYPEMPRWERMPGYFKGVDNFYPPMIELQKDYARQLLTHFNPYTRTAYVDEPAVALIEINNENGLICEWWSGSLDAMSDVYEAKFGSLWNRWLSQQYPGRDALERSWADSEESPGPEMLKERAFEKGTGTGSAWQLEQHEGAAANAAPADGGLRVTVQKTGQEDWHVQISQSGLAVAARQRYTVSFRARSDGRRRMTVGISQSHEPWNSLWSTEVRLTAAPQEFRFTFQPGADEKNARLIFSGLAGQQGEVCISDVSLHTGGIDGLRENESTGAVPIFKKADFAQRTDGAQKDWMRFLYDTETGYWKGMEKFLKEDLKIHSLVVGTATGYSPASIQTKLDVVDGHAYWQHPNFPHKAWDQADWTVKNVSMAGTPTGGTIPGLAGRRVAGKPYICTEYNAAAPNTYSSEAFLLLNAYAALQDWDGVFIFAYSHRHDDWDARRIVSFFDLDQHPTKLATLPAAVSLFLRGDVSKAKETITYPLPWEAAIEKSLIFGPWWEISLFGVSKTASLRSRVQIDTDARGPFAPTRPPAEQSGAGQSIVSDTGELKWESERGIVTINTPRSKAFIGRITGEAIKLDDVTIEPRKNRQNWAAITVTAMDGRNIASSGRILITATGDAKNTGTRWADERKDRLIGGDWGKAPSLVEVIPAKITLPLAQGVTNVKAWALDERGQRGEAVEVNVSNERAVIEIGVSTRTLWYEVDVVQFSP